MMKKCCFIKEDTENRKYSVDASAYSRFMITANTTGTTPKVTQ